MAIDFSLPTKTQNYDTGVLQTIRSNQIAIASFLDGHSITTNTAGLKRYNASSSLFEKSDGTSWTEMALAYLKLAGGTLTGALTLAGDGTTSLHPVSLQQMNTALSSKANSSALATYAPLSGAAFTGSLSTSGSFLAAGNVTASNALLSPAAYIDGIFVANGTLSATNAFYLGAYSTTLPVIQWDTGDSLRYDRSSNQLQAWAGGSVLLSLAASGTAINTALTLSCDLGGSYGGQIRLTNPATGGSPAFRVNPGNSLELIDAGYANVNATFADAGSLTMRGLLFGRGGGAGLGQISVQSGGSPSGGAAGDLCLIY